MVGGIHIRNKEDIGYVIWKLETLHDFVPCYEHFIQDPKQKNISHQQKQRQLAKNQNKSITDKRS